MSVKIAILASLLVAGFLGSFGHCLGMCGPLVMMLNTGLKNRKMPLLPNNLLYHSARIGIYGILGAAAGGLGSLAMSSGLSQAGGIFSLLMAGVVILFGLGYLGLLPLGQLESRLAMGGAGSIVTTGMSAALRRGGSGGALVLGGFNGLLPCGLVYGALPVAASMGSVVGGLVGMILFGLGTIPALMVLGMGAGRLSPALRQRLARLGGFFILLIGLQLALRGAAFLGWVSHVRVGGLMLW